MTIDAYVRANGGYTEVARRLAVSPDFLRQVATGMRPAPLGRVLAWERALDGALTRRDWRPKDYWLIWPDLSPPRGQPADAPTQETRHAT